MDGAAFFGNGEGGALPKKIVMTARGVCLSCPVRRDCFIHAVVEREPYGVWAGFTPRERQRIRELFGSLSAALADFGADTLFDAVVR